MVLSDPMKNKVVELNDLNSDKVCVIQSWADSNKIKKIPKNDNKFIYRQSKKSN